MSSGPILRDKVPIERFHRLNYASSCEECTHFDAFTGTCTFTFPTLAFLKKTQKDDLENRGEMAFCRMMEID